MSFPKFSVSAGESLVWAFLLLFRNTQLQGEASPAFLGGLGTDGAGGPSGHVLLGRPRETRPMIDLMVPHPVHLNNTALWLQTSGGNGFLEPAFVPCGRILEFILGLLLLECRKALTDTSLLENYKSLGKNKSVASLISNTLKYPDYLKLTSDNTRQYDFNGLQCFDYYLRDFLFFEASKPSSTDRNSEW